MVIAITAALLTVFLDFCMNEGNILSWYYRLILKLPDWLNKPLGTCIYCFGTWVYIGLYEYVGKFDLLLFILGLGVQFIAIKLYDKCLND